MHACHDYPLLRAVQCFKFLRAATFVSFGLSSAITAEAQIDFGQVTLVGQTSCNSAY